MSRRGRVLAVCCLLALAVLWWWCPAAAPRGDAELGGAQPAAGAAAAGDAERAAGRATPAAAATMTAAAGRRTPTPPTTGSPGAETPTLGPDDLARQPQVVALAARAADEYRQRAQYPPWSQPFDAEGADPILRDREVSPVTAAGPEGEEPILVAFPEQVGFEAPDPVLLYAYLTRGNERVPAQAIVGTLTSETLQPLGDFAYHDDGQDGDARAGDAIYSARLQLDDDMRPDLSDAFMVRVRALIDEGERIAATGFLYSNPHAQLTGRYRDTIVDGSLVIEAEIEVTRGGRFHLEGTLYDRSGASGLAEAHTAAELAPGRHWLALTFFGRILHQRAVDGPYLLRYLALSTTTRMPNAKNRLVENAHVTAAYRAAQFSDAPFEDPDLLDAADRLERSLEESP
jgi:hypothetical protein